MKTEPLNLEPDHQVLIDGPQAIWFLYIGNSGLQLNALNRDLHILEMHYLPDSYVGGKELDRETRYRYSIIFQAAFYAFCLWLSEFQETNGSPKPRFVEGKTNEGMDKLFQRLFNKRSQVYTCDSQYRCEFGLELLMEDKETLDELKKAYELCLSEQFSMRSFRN